MMFPSWEELPRREADQPDAGVTVAQIAKVREKVSDGNQEFDDVDVQWKMSQKPSEVDQEEDDDPAEEHITMPEETEEDE